MRYARTLLGVTLPISICCAAPARAQVLDSISLASDSRYVWRSYDLGGLTIRGAAAIGLAGFSTTHSSTQLNNLGLELATWNPLGHRSSTDVGSQYVAAIRYGRCIAACDYDEWSKRWTASVAINEYALPNATGKTRSTELEGTVRGYLDLERIGATQLGINISPFVTVDRDFYRYDRLYAAFGASTFFDAIGPYAAQITATAAMSNWPGVQTQRSFGYHGATYQFTLLRSLTLGKRHAELGATGTLETPSSQIGADRGVVSLHFNLLGPLLI